MSYIPSVNHAVHILVNHRYQRVKFTGYWYRGTPGGNSTRLWLRPLQNLLPRTSLILLNLVVRQLGTSIAEHCDFTIKKKKDSMKEQKSLVDFKFLSIYRSSNTLNMCRTDSYIVKQAHNMWWTRPNNNSCNRGNYCLTRPPNWSSGWFSYLPFWVTALSTTYAHLAVRSHKMATRLVGFILITLPRWFIFACEVYKFIDIASRINSECNNKYNSK